MASIGDVLGKINDFAIAVGLDIKAIYLDLALKAPLASPNLTGVPTAPTASGGTNTTQLATTAFVTGALGSAILTSGNQTIEGVKTFSSTLRVTNTFDINGTAAGAQQTGLYIADLGDTSGTTLNPTLTAAICAQVSNIRSVAFSCDGNYIYGFRTHSDAGTYTWISRVKRADVLHTSRNITLGSVTKSFDGSANISWTTAEVGWSTVPAGASDTGVAGQKAYDANFLYVCVATNTWKRVSLVTW